MQALYGFAFSERALESLAEIPTKFRQQVIKKAKALMTNPFPPTSKQLKGVTDSAGNPVRRERSGDYRILYVVREDPHEVVILDAGNRKDVYR
jgi:mRNA interferase RelE/StbE